MDEHSGSLVTGVEAIPRPLGVQFNEEAGSGDGVRRDFFTQVAAEIVSVDRGLFRSKDGGRTIQPNPDSATAGGRRLSWHVLRLLLLHFCCSCYCTPAATKKLLWFWLWFSFLFFKLEMTGGGGCAAGADHLSYFALMGRIAGLALFHNSPLNANYTTAFLKAVLEVRYTKIIIHHDAGHKHEGEIGG